MEPKKRFLPVLTMLSALPFWAIVFSSLVKTSYFGYFGGVLLFFLSFILFLVSLITAIRFRNDYYWWTSAFVHLATIALGVADMG